MHGQQASLETRILVKVLSLLFNTNIILILLHSNNKYRAVKYESRRTISTTRSWKRPKSTGRVTRTSDTCRHTMIKSNKAIEGTFSVFSFHIHDRIRDCRGAPYEHRRYTLPSQLNRSVVPGPVHVIRSKIRRTTICQYLNARSQLTRGIHSLVSDGLKVLN